jgi:hypothetical protein
MKKLEIKWLDTLPSYMQDGIRQYLEEGVIPGKFLRNILMNNLVQSFGHADQHNKVAMEEWVNFLFNYLPANAWGSEEVVNRWSAERKEFPINIIFV